MFEAAIKWFRLNCRKILQERNLISLHRPIFVAFGIVVALTTAVIVGGVEYLWFSSSISARDNEIRIKNATIENLQNKPSPTSITQSTPSASAPPAPLSETAVSYTSLRLLMRLNQDPEELSQKNNVWRWWTQPVNIADQNGKIIQSTRFFFLVFDHPAITSYRRVFSPNKPELKFNIVELSARSMIVVTYQDTDNAIIEFQTGEKPL